MVWAKDGAKWKGGEDGMKKFSTEMDVSVLPAGVYFVSLVQSGQVLRTAKLVVE